MRFNLGDASLNVGLFSCTLNNSSFVFSGNDLMGGAENFKAGIFEAHTFVGGNNGCASKDGDIFHNFLAAITEGWSFEDERIKYTFEFIEDEDAKCFAFDFFGDNYEILATGLSHFFKEWNNVVDCRNLFVGDENFWFVENGFLTVGVSNKECGCETFIVSETLGNFGLHFETLSLLYRNDAVFADFFDNVSNKFADFGVAGRNSGDFSDFLTIAVDFFGGFVDIFNDFCASKFNAFTEVHWVMSGSNKFVGFSNNIIS